MTEVRDLVQTIMLLAWLIPTLTILLTVGFTLRNRRY